MQHIENQSIVKLVLVVRDIEAKVDAFVALFGMERPKVITTSPPPAGSKAFTELRGKRITGRVKLTSLAMGAVSLELIEPVDEVSPWAEHLREHGEGIFSVVCTVGNFEQHVALMQDKGMPLYHLGEYGAGRYSYYETLGTLGITLCLQNLEKRF